ncbi:MAG: dTDP-4-dehydrorhamnose 3,5-epimerase [Heliobacteriaceae bacterium]|jgi:dTDP-4-dehydrorhamnose 3,5-epimerase|nr:dTDP-4-dehydrorhamnose 3,5-epimerase [Heliobacteriaceae bacterium]
MAFEFERLGLGGVILVKPKVFTDDRGEFMETYKKSEFYANGIDVEFNQDNRSKSGARVLRGLHYHKHGQAKLVCCLKGKIHDVAVDLETGKWVRVELSEENKHILYIPAGFAHGFAVLSEEAQVAYKISGEYSPEHDCGIRWNSFDIDWGIDFEPVLSQRDRGLEVWKIRGMEV